MPFGALAAFQVALAVSTATDLWIFLYDYATYLFARHSVEISGFLC